MNAMVGFRDPELNIELLVNADVMYYSDVIIFPWSHNHAVLTYDVVVKFFSFSTLLKLQRKWSKALIQVHLDSDMGHWDFALS